MKSILLVLAVSATVLLSTPHKTIAGSATWRAHPPSGDWNAAANWNPATVPDSASDTATFRTSDQRNLFFSDRTTVGGIVFKVGASPFAIAAGENIALTLSGAGVSNPSLIMQNFFAVGASSAGVAGGIINFENSASADTAILTARGGEAPNADGGTVNFFGNSTAAGCVSVTEGGAIAGAFPGVTEFLANATAANANLTVQGGAAKNSAGGFVSFVDSSDAATATIIANGGTAANATGGTIQFVGDSTADAATLFAQIGVEGGTGGQILFLGKSDGGTSRIILVGQGSLDISRHAGNKVTVGSIEDDGSVFLGAKELVTGTNNIGSTFSGIIQDGPSGFGGALTKIGSGTLILSGRNSYTGGTIIREGALALKSRNSSSAGTGPVQVKAGTLGGTGNIIGAVTVGNGSGRGAALQPALEGHTPAIEQISNSLTFNSDATFIVRLRSKQSAADGVAAVGVTIERGAQINFSTIGTTALRGGTVLTLINNKSATPIAGVFANLADGSSFTQGNNTFAVSYEGGDGNDLTLTLVPSSHS